MKVNLVCLRSFLFILFYILTKFFVYIYLNITFEFITCSEILKFELGIYDFKQNISTEINTYALKNPNTPPSIPPMFFNKFGLNKFKLILINILPKNKHITNNNIHKTGSNARVMLGLNNSDMRSGK